VATYSQVHTWFCDSMAMILRPPRAGPRGSSNQQPPVALVYFRHARRSHRLQNPIGDLGRAR
jgi:hypothetical protein